MSEFKKVLLLVVAVLAFLVAAHTHTLHPGRRVWRGLHSLRKTIPT
jgi:hypothetical protein